MKKLLFITLSLISFVLLGNNINEEVLFKASIADSVEITRIANNGNSNLLEIDFTSINCDSLLLNFGYTITPYFPAYLDTLPNQIVPILLDKTQYASTYRGLTSNFISIDLLQYNANYLWLEIINNPSCTSGEVILRLKD